MIGILRSQWYSDDGRKQTQPADPRYPNGTCVAQPVKPGAPSCTKSLPYPVPDCGWHHVTCLTCKLSVVLSTAGRADDPREITVACKLEVVGRKA